MLLLNKIMEKVGKCLYLNAHSFWLFKNHEKSFFLLKILKVLHLYLKFCINFKIYDVTT